MVSFIENANSAAQEVMDQIDPTLSVKYVTVIEFLCDNPNMAATGRSKDSSEIGTLNYIKVQALNFKKGREPKTPEPPKTIPDEMVGIILNQYFNVPADEIQKAKEWHLLSMGAENLVGDLLERYIAHTLEDEGWVWCSGSVVRSVDFIYRDEQRQWQSLQVKNRDNSENSSSSAIRNGTPIKKWHRTFSKKQGDNWKNFPLKTPHNLSEENFKKFVGNYLQNLKSIMSND